MFPYVNFLILIERLSSEEVAELFRWLSEREWESWYKEIEADSQAGELDFLVREALQEKAKGTLMYPLPPSWRTQESSHRKGLRTLY